MDTTTLRSLLRLLLPALATRFTLGGFALLLALTPLRVAATTVVPPTFEELVNESEYVVRTVVKSLTYERRERNGQSLIYTLVEFEVREVVAGTPPQPLVLRMLGGQVGDEVLEVSGAPKFVIGQEDVLFVRGNGRQFTPLTAMMHGRYPVLKEAATGRAYMARSNHAPLQAVSEVSRPMSDSSAQAKAPAQSAVAQALSPETFIQQIRNTLNPNYRPARAK